MWITSVASMRDGPRTRKRLGSRGKRTAEAAIDDGTA
jgi:hypothetical protein